MLSNTLWLGLSLFDICWIFVRSELGWTRNIKRKLDFSGRRKMSMCLRSCMTAGERKRVLSWNALLRKSGLCYQIKTLDSFCGPEPEKRGGLCWTTQNFVIPENIYNCQNHFSGVAGVHVFQAIGFQPFDKACAHFGNQLPPCVTQIVSRCETNLVNFAPVKEGNAFFKSLQMKLKITAETMNAILKCKEGGSDLTVELLDKAHAIEQKIPGCRSHWLCKQLAEKGFQPKAFHSGITRKWAKNYALSSCSTGYLSVFFQGHSALSVTG